MKLITQTILGDVDGDCLPCCIAMITRIPLRRIPNFCAGNNRNWWADCLAWLKSKGWCGVLIKHEAAVRSLADLSAVQSSAFPVIAIDGAHAVVLTGGRQHDPHPSRRGLAAWDALILLCPLPT